MERKQLLAPVEWKTVADDPGMLEGYVSVFNNVDDGGDVVLPGAFKKTLADWAQSKRRIPLLADHKMSTDGVIGSIVHAVEDKVGLRVRAQFSSIQKAQDVRTNLIEGHINGMSFTYEPIRTRPGTKSGQRVRFLEELRWFEGTITPFPMNTLATPTMVKTAAEADVFDYEQFAEAMTKALQLPTAASKAAVAVLLSEYQAAGPADGLSTADAAATTDEPEPAGDTATEGKTTSYALEFLKRISEPRDDALDGRPPDAPAAVLMPLENAQTTAALDQLEADVLRRLGKVAS